MTHSITKADLIVLIKDPRHRFNHRHSSYAIPAVDAEVFQIVLGYVERPSFFTELLDVFQSGGMFQCYGGIRRWLSISQKWKGLELVNSA